jgi:hypothetical protein
MSFILDFKKFILKESETTELPEVREFKDAFENSEWGKILSRDSTIEPKRTGRIYLITSYLPSKTQIEKRGDTWVYWYSSGGRDYGHKYMPTAELLIRELVYDSIRKGNDSIPRNELDKFLEDHNISLKVLSEPNVTVGYPRNGQISAYQAIKDHEAGESGIIHDLSGISSPYLDFLKQEGFTIDARGRDLEITFKLIRLLPDEAQSGLPPFFKDVKEVMEKSGSVEMFRSDNYVTGLIFRLKGHAFSRIKITASGEGTSVQKGASLDIITLGYSDEVMLIKALDDILRKQISSELKLSIGRGDKIRTDSPLDAIKRETRRFFKEGSSVNMPEEEKKYLMARLRTTNRII